jgi:hypothetical protein
MSQHSPHAEDRITRDDMAVLARTSPNTIRRDIKSTAARLTPTPPGESWSASPTRCDRTDSAG